MALSAADRIAYLIKSRGQTEKSDEQELIPMSIRVPETLAQMLTRMATLSDCSRNEMINMLLKSAFDEAMDAIEPQARAEILRASLVIKRISNI